MTEMFAFRKPEPTMMKASAAPQTVLIALTITGLRAAMIIVDDTLVHGLALDLLTGRN